MYDTQTPNRIPVHTAATQSSQRKYQFNTLNANIFKTGVQFREKYFTTGNMNNLSKINMVYCK